MATPQIDSSKAGANFCVFSRTEQALRQGSNSQLLRALFPSSLRSSYRSDIDLLFCQLHPEWNEACFAYYEGQGQRLFCLQGMAPLKLLELDTRMSEVQLPRIRELFLSGRRRWATILKQIEGDQKANNATPRPTVRPKMPTSLDVHRSCSDSLEKARLRGSLCRLVHDAIDAALYLDQEWFDRRIESLREFIQGHSTQKIGGELAAQILVDRVRYVSALESYQGIRTKIMKMIKHHRRRSDRSPQREVV
jgi:hypothetical protein